MYIEKQYSHERKILTDYFYIEIRVKENNAFLAFLRNTDDLVDPGCRYISIENLNNEEFLKNHNIEYIAEENQATKEKEVIPIGLFEFNDYDKYSYSELRLWHIGIEGLYKVEAIVKNIEKAIATKYEALKLKNKCTENKTEEIELK